MSEFFNSVYNRETKQVDVVPCSPQEVADIMARKSGQRIRPFAVPRWALKVAILEMKHGDTIAKALESADFASVIKWNEMQDIRSDSAWVVEILDAANIDQQQASKLFRHAKALAAKG